MAEGPTQEELDVVKEKVLTAIEDLKGARPGSPANPPIGLPSTLSNLIGALNKGPGSLTEAWCRRR